MERETSDYVLRAVTKAQLKVLIAGGAYTNKQGCLTRPMNDGRLEIIMEDSEIATLERLYAEVDAEERELDEPSPLELPETPITLAPQPPAPSIPQCDKDAWQKLCPDVIPDRGPSERPRDGGTTLGSSGIGGNRINLDGLFNR